MVAITEIEFWPGDRSPDELENTLQFRQANINDHERAIRDRQQSRELLLERAEERSQFRDEIRETFSDRSENLVGPCITALDRACEHNREQAAALGTSVSDLRAYYRTLLEEKNQLTRKLEHLRETGPIRLTRQEIREQLRGISTIPNQSITMGKNGTGAYVRWCFEGITYRPDENNFRHICDGGIPEIPVPATECRIYLTGQIGRVTLRKHRKASQDECRYYYNPEHRDVHPHIMSDGQPCLGDYSTPIIEAIHDRDIQTTATVLEMFLSAAAADDPAGATWINYFGPLTAYERFCGKFVRRDENGERIGYWGFELDENDKPVRFRLTSKGRRLAEDEPEEPYIPDGFLPIQSFDHELDEPTLFEVFTDGGVFQEWARNPHEIDANVLGYRFVRNNGWSLNLGDDWVPDTLRGQQVEVTLNNGYRMTRPPEMLNWSRNDMTTDIATWRLAGDWHPASELSDISPDTHILAQHTDTGRLTQGPARLYQGMPDVHISAWMEYHPHSDLREIPIGKIIFPPLGRFIFQRNPGADFDIWNYDVLNTLKSAFPRGHILFPETEIWHGGEQPLPNNYLIAYRTRSGRGFSIARSHEVYWEHDPMISEPGDIVEYCVLQMPREYQEAS